MENSNKYNEEQLRKEAPTLFGIKKETPVVPEGYFENLPESIIEKLKEKSEKRTWWGSFFSNRLIRYSSLAMSLGVLVIGVILFSNENEVGVNPITIAGNTTKIDFSEEELEEIADFDLAEEDIIEFYSEDEEIAVPVMELCECDVDDMIEYIYDTEIETDLLIQILEQDENITI